MPHPREALQQIVVTARQMSDIESRIFEAGMPVAALMEKVGSLLSQRVMALFPRAAMPQVGILVGPGHNGGDALVVARELHFQGYAVRLYRPITKAKDLTQQHLDYAKSLGIPVVEGVNSLQDCDWLLDGLFGFGLERPLEGEIAAAVNQINGWSKPIFSIDLPSGLHTDTGAVLGTAIRATHTACLGLWKLAFLQDPALAWIGQAELIDFGIPMADVQAVLGEQPTLQRITAQSAIAALPLPRPASTHKYKMGHLLLICGSRQYLGATVLSGMGARASGVGMLSMAVPATLKTNVSAQLPEALIQICPEQENGAIAQFPEDLNLSQYDAIACGPGLTTQAQAIVEQVIASDRPLLLDADGLNITAQLGNQAALAQRPGPTVLTPHPGEFKRLFPDLAAQPDPTEAVQAAAQQSQSIVVLKGARVAIAYPDGRVIFNPNSTPALARGGSGDVLTGLIGGLMAQAAAAQRPITEMIPSAVWWHAQAGILGAAERTELGVDAFTLSQYLPLALRQATAPPSS